MGEKGLGLTRYPFNKLVKIVMAYTHTSTSDKPGRVKCVIEEKHQLDPDNYKAGMISSTFKKLEDGVVMRFIFNRYSHRKEFDYPVGELPEGDISMGSELLRLYNERKLEVRDILVKTGR